MTDPSPNPPDPPAASLPARGLRLIVSLLLATAVWLAVLPVLYRADPSDYRASGEVLPPKARALAQRHLELWTNDEKRQVELEKMRGTNAEWDFMGRTFLVLALADMSMRDPSYQPDALVAIDAIIDETVRLEEERGHVYYLLPYAQASPWLDPSKRSLFVDGEIALMQGARRMLVDTPEYEAAMNARVELITAQLERGPVLSGESYPDECWMFCNTAALAALSVHQALGGPDHRPLQARWLERARTKLTHPDTGLLISSYRWDGSQLDGPEGSSIWMAAHCLRVVDPEYARDQYERARGELLVNVLGFGYGKEWPASWQGPMDVDSGPIVPVVEASAGSSGLALLGASSFDDHATLGTLITSLDFAAFPIEDESGLRYCASNQVGDAVLLYALVQGPMWERVNEARQ
ncbi:hypothetical protein OAX78_03605 [Planctomycetota bacterium]|nr:hypothetical protein [Planctomycetota bacterium]